MIKLFRITRQRLLTENKFNQYLLYAIGEIILVVIGILIAVSINNWNTDRNNQRKEKEILIHLQQEYHKNLKEIDEKILMRNLIMESIEILVSYIDSGIANTSSDTLSLHFGRTKYDPTFDPAMGVTMELLNSGKLYLITNSKLKNHLTSWSSNVEKLVEQEQLMATCINDDYIPYLLKRFKIRNFSNSKRDDKMDDLFSMGGSKSFFVPMELKKEVFLDYLEDLVVENYIIHIGNLAYMSNRQSEGLRENIKTILRIIDLELNRN